MTPEPRLLPANGNWRRGRGGHRIQALVVHVMEGSLEGTDSWFRRPPGSPNPVSAHYGISKDGRIVQWVRDEDVAYANGEVVRPTAAIVKQLGGNPNQWTLSVECEGHGTDEPTSALMASLAEWVRAKTAEHGIPLDREHVLRHQEIKATKTCPGVISVDKTVAMARALGSAGAPRVGDKRWSPFLGEYVYVTAYISDTDWEFLPEGELKKLGRPAQSPFSEMPGKKP